MQIWSLCAIKCSSFNYEKISWNKMSIRRFFMVCWFGLMTFYLPVKINQSPCHGQLSWPKYFIVLVWLRSSYTRVIIHWIFVLQQTTMQCYSVLNPKEQRENTRKYLTHVDNKVESKWWVELKTFRFIHMNSLQLVIWPCY